MPFRAKLHRRRLMLFSRRMLILIASFSMIRRHFRCRRHDYAAAAADARHDAAILMSRRQAALMRIITCRHFCFC